MTQIEVRYAAGLDGAVWLNVTDAITQYRQAGYGDDEPLVMWLRDVEAVAREHQPA
jgi:hypothetical protein